MTVLLILGAWIGALIGIVAALLAIDWWVRWRRRRPHVLSERECQELAAPRKSGHVDRTWVERPGSPNGSPRGEPGGTQQKGR